MSHSRSNNSNTSVKGKNKRQRIDTFANLRNRQIAPLNEKIFQEDPALAKQIHDELLFFFEVAYNRSVQRHLKLIISQVVIAALDYDGYMDRYSESTLNKRSEGSEYVKEILIENYKTFDSKTGCGFENFFAKCDSYDVIVNFINRGGSTGIIITDHKGTILFKSNYYADNAKRKQQPTQGLLVYSERPTKRRKLDSLTDSNDYVQDEKSDSTSISEVDHMDSLKLELFELIIDIEQYAKKEAAKGVTFKLQSFDAALKALGSDMSASDFFENCEACDLDVSYSKKSQSFVVTNLAKTLSFYKDGQLFFPTAMSIDTEQTISTTTITTAIPREQVDTYELDRLYTQQQYQEPHNQLMEPIQLEENFSKIINDNTPLNSPQMMTTTATFTQPQQTVAYPQDTASTHQAKKRKINQTQQQAQQQAQPLPNHSQMRHEDNRNQQVSNDNYFLSSNTNAIKQSSQIGYEQFNIFNQPQTQQYQQPQDQQSFIPSQPLPRSQQTPVVPNLAQPQQMSTNRHNWLNISTQGISHDAIIKFNRYLDNNNAREARRMWCDDIELRSLIRGKKIGFNTQGQLVNQTIPFGNVFASFKMALSCQDNNNVINGMWDGNEILQDGIKLLDLVSSQILRVV